MSVGVFSPVFPNAMPFIDAYFTGIARQEHTDFTLWLALDRLNPQDVVPHVPDGLSVEIVPSRGDDTPARLRERVWRTMASAHDVTVMVDADDVPGPLRVAAAVEACQSIDIYACALDIIDADGRRLGAQLAPPAHVKPLEHVLEWNVFGLSNTAFTSAALRRLLPLSDDVRLVDWYLITLASSLELRTVFDHDPHLSYRQYAANTARILPPLSVPYLRRAADLVVEQLASVASEHERRGLPFQPLTRRRDEVAAFARQGDAVLEKVANQHQPSGRACYLWWEYVAPRWWVESNLGDS